MSCFATCGSPLADRRSFTSAGRSFASVAELEDVKAAGSDAESDDVLAAVAAAVARDKQVQAELASQARQRFARYASSDSEDEAGTAAAGGRRRGGAAAANGGLAADVARFAGSSDEEGEGGPAGVVEFGGGDGGNPERRAAKRRKRDAAAAAAGEGSKRPKAATVSVRPGELVHAGAVAGGAGGGAAQGGEGGFAALGLSQQLADHLAAHGFAAPTGVQQQSIPVLLGRRDALVNAPTGSGKTLRWVAAGGWGRAGGGLQLRVGGGTGLVGWGGEVGARFGAVM